MSHMIEIWNVFSPLIVFLSGLIVAIKTSKYFQVRQIHGVFLYTWHSIFCITYYWYAITFGADSLMYYNVASLGETRLWPGTPAVVLLNSIFIYNLKFSLLSAFLVNNIYGFLGLLAFKGSLNTAVLHKSKHIKNLAWLIVILPSASFWSSALGKDSISFMSACFALWAALNLEKRYPLLFISIIFMFLVRPHIAGILVIALGMSMAFSAKVSFLKRLLIGSVMLTISISLIPFALNYAGVSDPDSAEGVMSYIESRQSQNMIGGGSVDISSMSLPMKMFTYLYRPTLLEARNIFSLASALDNLILLYLSILGIFSLIKKKNIQFTENRKFLWIYVLMTWWLLAMTTANLGISVRQKWMFTPILIFLLISVIGKNKYNMPNHNRQLTQKDFN